MSAKRAKLYATCFELECPYCGEGMETGPNSQTAGSLMWSRYEMADDAVVGCSSCRRYVRVKLPKRVEVR